MVNICGCLGFGRKELWHNLRYNFGFSGGTVRITGLEIRIWECASKKQYYSLNHYIQLTIKITSKRSRTEDETK